MPEERDWCRRDTSSRERDRECLAFAPSIGTDDIFRQLIADEIRNGRLSPSRRRRVVRYAAQLGLSAVEAGELIVACREEALQSNDSTEQFHALRLVEPPPPAVPIPIKIALVVGLAILLDLLVVAWLW